MDKLVLPWGSRQSVLLYQFLFPSWWLRYRRDCARLTATGWYVHSVRIRAYLRSALCVQSAEHVGHTLCAFARANVALRGPRARLLSHSPTSLGLSLSLSLYLSLSLCLSLSLSLALSLPVAVACFCSSQILLSFEAFHETRKLSATLVHRDGLSGSPP